MTWKTDWKSTDNYAENGIEQFGRLMINYSELQLKLFNYLGLQVTLSPITTNGYKTWPFDDFLNTVELNLRALHVLNVSNWIPFNGIWRPGGFMPGFNDINRWEQNGKLIEEGIMSITNDLLYCGEFFLGTNRDDQYYEI